MRGTTPSLSRLASAGVSLALVRFGSRARLGRTLSCASLDVKEDEELPLDVRSLLCKSGCLCEVVYC